jgi:hypothetical protein
MTRGWNTLVCMKQRDMKYAGGKEKKNWCTVVLFLFKKIKSKIHPTVHRKQFTSFNYTGTSARSR